MNPDKKTIDLSCYVNKSTVRLLLENLIKSVELFIMFTLIDTKCDNRIDIQEFRDGFANLQEFGYNPFPPKNINIQIPQISQANEDIIENDNYADDMDQDKLQAIIDEEYKMIDTSSNGMGEITFFEFAVWARDKGLKLRNVLPCTDEEEIDYENGDCVKAQIQKQHDRDVTVKP